jgi:hypothetical protein
MDRSNVTISLPDDLLREARHLAVDQGVSLSKFLSQLLAERVEAARLRGRSWERQRKLLEKGLTLGTHGEIAWKRESTHER